MMEFPLAHQTHRNETLYLFPPLRLKLVSHRQSKPFIQAMLHARHLRVYLPGR